MVEEACRKLGEHFESVHIFVTFPEDDGQGCTGSIDYGVGNHYATLGQIAEWLAIQHQFQKNWAIRKDAEKE